MYKKRVGKKRRRTPPYPKSIPTINDGQRSQSFQYQKRTRENDLSADGVNILNELLELGDIGTENLTDLRTFVVGLEGRHGADSSVGGDLAEDIDIDLDKLDINVLLGEIFVLGGNDLAGTIFIKLKGQLEEG
jgi:hypothetical protein